METLIDLVNRPALSTRDIFKKNNKNKFGKLNFANAIQDTVCIRGSPEKAEASEAMGRQLRWAKRKVENLIEKRVLHLEKREYFCSNKKEGIIIAKEPTILTQGMQGRLERRHPTH